MRCWMKRDCLPVSVYLEAQQRFRDSVEHWDLYCCWAFGHARPDGLTHKRTLESLFRGAVRRSLQGYLLRKGQ